MRTVLVRGDDHQMKFRKIYREMYPKLIRQAAFLLGDAAAAEDMVQEAFLKLHNFGFDEINNPKAWLTKVTNNLCYSYMRSEGSRRRREETVCRQSLNQLTSGAAVSAESVILDWEELQMVRQALNRLSPRDRIVLLLKFSGYKYDQIAEAVDVNRSSVGAILARARERFKREYNNLLSVH